MEPLLQYRTNMFHFSTGRTQGPTYFDSILSLPKSNDSILFLLMPIQLRFVHKQLKFNDL